MIKREMIKKRDDLRDEPIRLEILCRITRVLFANTRLDELLQMILDVLILNLRADTGSIMLLDREGGELFIKISRGLDQEIAKKFHTRLGENISGIVAQQKRPYLLLDGRLPKEFRKVKVRKEVNSCLCAPLPVLDRVIGVISVVRTKTGESLTEDDLELLWVFVQQAAQAIFNAQFYEEMENKPKQDGVYFKRAKERLKELGHPNGSFLDLAAHELRTPLTSIKGYAECLLTQEVDPRTRQEFLGIINHEAERMSEVIDNLLDFLKTTSSITL